MFATWNNLGAMTTTTAVPTIESLRELMRNRPRPEPEQVIVTPSLEALRAVVPFQVELDPTGRRTMDGVRVVVTKYAARPQLIPAADLRLYQPALVAIPIDDWEPRA
jgi:hypothetical protein